MYEDNFIKVSTEEQREDLATKLSEAEDWIYDQEEETAEIFENKLAELQEVSDPILLRAHELDAYPEALEKTLYFINGTRHLLKNATKALPWVNEKEFKKLEEKLEHVAEWVKNKTDEQSQLQPTDPPAVTASALMNKLKPLAKLSQSIFKRPKPKDWDRKQREKKRAEKAAKKKNATNVTNSTTDADEEEVLSREDPLGEKPQDKDKTTDGSDSGSEEAKDEKESESVEGRSDDGGEKKSESAEEQSDDGDEKKTDSAEERSESPKDEL
jgi:hypothetical protein